jgi:hypothetical protein
VKCAPRHANWRDLRRSTWLKEEVESDQKDDLKLPDYWLTLTYEDVARKGWITKARFVGSEDRYTDLTINTQEEGAYGLRKDSELLKPVT